MKLRNVSINFKEMKRFWEVIYDDKKWTFDLIESSDDTLFTNNVAMLQLEGFAVHCQTANLGNISSKEANLIGYKREHGLYNRLLTEYEIKSGKIAKRW